MSENETSEAAPADPVAEAFDTTCRQLAGFDGRIDTEWADGFLTAVAASWRAIPADEWLPALAGDAFERAFADPAAETQARTALESRLALLRDELDPEALLDDQDHLRIAPLMQVWDDAARRQLVDEGHAGDEDAAQLQTGAVWAEGFFAAVEHFAADWPEPGPDEETAEYFHAMLETVAALAWDPAGEDFKAFARKGWKDADPTRDELIDEACFAIQDLRLYWVDCPPKQAPRRVAATPGRNDPCPCGSGKKFKKCHGA